MPRSARVPIAKATKRTAKFDAILAENDGQKPQILPDWDELRGVAPDATGDLSSEEFVRNLRAEWPEST